MFLEAFYLPGSILNADDTYMNKTKDESLFFGAYILLWAETKPASKCKYTVM